MNKTLLSLALAGSLLSLPSQADWLLRDTDMLSNLSNESFTYTFTNLNDHEYVKFNFDLLIVDSWDGDRDDDNFGLIIDGETYVWSFINSNTSLTNNAQTYPSNGVNLSQNTVTGLSDDLTSYTSWGADFYENFNDGWLFAHTGDSLTITLFAENLQAINDETWAFQNLAIATGDSSVELEALGNLNDVPVQGGLLASILAFSFLGSRRKKK
jgi:hypothetical protein